MGPSHRRGLLAVAVATALGTVPDARAVRLDTDGVGQALIYPYYTAQSSGPNPLNTYVSIVNHAADTKALRVRFRDGRMGAETLSFNLFLSPNDAWTGAIVPSGSAGTTLATTDSSCVDPPFSGNILGAATTVDFRNAAYSGANDDGAGAGLDRTREGFLEVLEMATLAGASAQAVAHNAAGLTTNCRAMVGNAAPALAPPTGGISGTFTLINVANGMDFSGNADALADLGTRAYFRVAGDPYPDLNALEIDTVSALSVNGNMYRATWARSVDAITAVLMRSQWQGEYVLDTATASQTDFVVTFPTRRFYVSGSTMASPFSGGSGWARDCGASASPTRGDVIEVSPLDREAVSLAHTVGGARGATEAFCGVANVFSVERGGTAGGPFVPSDVLGSTNGGFSSGSLHVPDGTQDGWLAMVPTRTQRFVSGGTSTRMNVLSGATTSGSHSFVGLPVVGFTVRTFRNGTLDCGGVSCQGNYGSAFPLKYLRSIAP